MQRAARATQLTATVAEPEFVVVGQNLLRLHLHSFASCLRPVVASAPFAEQPNNRSTPRFFFPLWSAQRGRVDPLIVDQEQVASMQRRPAITISSWYWHWMSLCVVSKIKCAIYVVCHKVTVKMSMFPLLLLKWSFGGVEYFIRLLFDGLTFVKLANQSSCCCRWFPRRHST